MSTHCVGVILAGGGATRFGGLPKGLQLVDGVRMIDRVATALRAVTDELLLVANAPDARLWLPGVRTEVDVRRGEGALGGLHASLAHARGAAVLVVAWDMPYASEGLLRALRARGEQGFDAVVPESETSGRGVEPLCAWYGPACLPAIERRLDAGDRRVVSFHDDVRTARLSAAEVSQWGEPAHIFFNVNTPDDLPTVPNP
ncbi:MAG TPA: molybdenum cofactor guanylyltransferase [Gemmatimonadaceae bacterium]|jgi:molybdopterin-guanine dinucleotide biosynthesis protein A